MTQPVEISDDLISAARRMAEGSDRSIGDQIEFWAHLGQAIEPLLRGNSPLAIQQTEATRSLSEAIRDVSTASGRQRVQNLLQTFPYPHFEAVAGSPELVRKVEADGTVTVGKFVNRVFQPVEP